MDPNTTNFNEAPATGKIVNHPPLSNCKHNPASEGAFNSKLMWMDVLMKRYLFLALLALGFSIPASAQTTIFNCSSFSSAGACAAIVAGYGTQSFIIRNGGNLSGNRIDFVPTNSGHNGYGLTYYTPVNVQAFTTTFTFIPNGQNIAFVIQNTTNQSGDQGNIFSAGAGCESGFYQGSTAPPYYYTPNFLWALELSSEDWLTYGSEEYTYSGTQIYQSNQNPCNPGQGSDTFAYFAINKDSTSPVSLNGRSCPSGQTCPNGRFSTSGDIYSATITYDGYTVTYSMYDVTAGGSCPGAHCFTRSYSGVYIPSYVGATTAYVGFASGINIANLPALYINSWSYTVNPPTGTPSYTAWDANSTYNTGADSSPSPVYSLAPGTYSGTQSVTITTSGSPNNYICYTLAATTPTLFPTVDNNGGCSAGTLYTGPVSISSTATLYAMAGSKISAFSNADSFPAGLGPPSTLVAGTYTISGSTEAKVATPAFSPAAGGYTSAQSVTISDSTPDASIYYTTNGTTPTTSSTKYTGPITVSTTETLQAIAVDTDDINSAIATSAYTIVSGSGFSISPPSPSTWTTGCDPLFGTLQADGLCKVDIFIKGNFQGLTCAQTQVENSTTVWTECSYKPLP
jgi:hypothetical protein